MPIHSDGNIFMDDVKDLGMLAALVTINEAIVRIKDRDQLFGRICAVAVDEGKVLGVGCYLDGSEPATVDFHVGAGPGVELLRGIRIPVGEDTERGLKGMTGVAYRSGRACWSNDFVNDDRFLSEWREMARHHGIGAAAAVPIMQGGRAVGALVFYIAAAGSLTPKAIELLERLVSGLSFALDGIVREEERRRAEAEKDRLSRMFASLSATNEAILRSADADEMILAVCETAAREGVATSAAIFLTEPGTHWLALRGCAGSLAPLIRQMKASRDPTHEFGAGLHGPAMSGLEAVVSHDLAADDRVEAWREAAAGRGLRTGVAAPLIQDGAAVGVMYFLLGAEAGRQDEGVVRTMQRMADNVAFGLGVFERERRNARLTRMFAALSNTNEAVARARTRQELHQMVAEAAASGGQFSCVVVGFADETGETLETVGAAGPESASGVRFAAASEDGDGRALAASAFRSRKMRTADGLRPFGSDPGTAGGRSGAAFPLLSHGVSCGFLMFMTQEDDVFGGEFAELLQRLADNMSYALDAFSRAEEKERADRRVAYLATHDALTGLPNRLMFTQMLNEAADCGLRFGERFAVMFIDLDLFKTVNDTFGHATGDLLLVETARRITSNLRAGDCVARLGGDEFVVMLRDMSSQDVASRVAAKLISAVSEPMELVGARCRVTASIGISMYPDHGRDDHTLTKHADMAMYLAKRQGKDGFAYYCDALGAGASENFKVVSMFSPDPSQVRAANMRLDAQAQAG